ncbi:Pre-rRNA-processing protein PNO1 [Dictyocoela muelleri]|nr:Pre-rRNA-processing protein PNO1 [Dictyocoela muelleri]
MNELAEDHEYRTIIIPIPIVKVKPLKRIWMQIYEPLVNISGLQVRMNLQAPSIDLRSIDCLALERGRIFINAILKGFSPIDCVSALKDDDTSVVSFRISDVKKLPRNGLERAIGRIIGTDGKMKSTIENTTRCKLIVFDDEISILGTPDNTKMARDAVCRLIMGSKPNSISNRLKILSSKRKIAMSTIFSVPYKKDD